MNDEKVPLFAFNGTKKYHVSSVFYKLLHKCYIYQLLLFLAKNGLFLIYLHIFICNFCFNVSVISECTNENFKKYHKLFYIPYSGSCADRTFELMWFI